LKLATRPISGRINDIAWDSESKRIIAVGDGKERYGHAFSFDTGNSVGEIIGHSKTINSCCIKPSRPFRAVTCSDDMQVNFYHGPPFKFNKSLSDHTRFVQCVRYSSDGAHFISCSSDGQIILYDGTSGDKKGNFTGHSGGVFSVSWGSPKSFVSASADKTVKFWDVENMKVSSSLTLGDQVDDQQVGVLWVADQVLSLSLNGDLNYIDPRTSVVSRKVYGHQKAITAFAIDKSTNTFYSGSYDGKVYNWKDGLATPVSGVGHTNQVCCLSLNGEKNGYSVGLDDKFKCVDLVQKSFTNISIPTQGLPKCVSSVADTTAVATVKGVQLIKDGKEVGFKSLSYSALAVAVSSNGKNIAVGGEDQKVSLYDSSLNLLKSSQAHRGHITVLAYSPDGKYIAAGDADRKIVVYDSSTLDAVITEWVSHTAKVNCMSWSDDSKFLVSGGLDRDIYVWSVDNPLKSASIKGAHQEGVTGIGFLEKGVVASVGQDACLKVWSVDY
jgi:WD40 repeat protein